MMSAFVVPLPTIFFAGRLRCESRGLQILHDFFPRSGFDAGEGVIDGRMGGGFGDPRADERQNDDALHGGSGGPRVGAPNPNTAPIGSIAPLVATLFAKDEAFYHTLAENRERLRQWKAAADAVVHRAAEKNTVTNRDATEPVQSRLRRLWSSTSAGGAGPSALPSARFRKEESVGGFML